MAPIEETSKYHKFTEMYGPQNPDLQEKGIPFEGSILANINYEVPGTERFTENSQKIQGHFQFPVLTRFMEHMEGKLLELSNKVSENIKTVQKLLMEDLMEVGLLSTENSKISHNLSELNTMIVYANAQDFEDDLIALHLNALVTSIFFIIDDNFDKTKKNSDELIVDEKTQRLFKDCLMSTIEGESVNVDFRTSIQCKEMGELLNSLILLIKKVQNLLKLNCPLFLDVIQRRHTLKVWISYLWSTIWFQKISFKDISDEIYFNLRIYLIGLHCVVEFWALTKGYCLDDNMRSDPMFLRILTAGGTICGLINDIMGFSKELDNNEYDNYILLKYRQGMPLEKAFQRAHEIINRECSDYISMSQKFREVHAENINAQKFIDIIDFELGNLIPIHATLHRYPTTCWINGKLVSKDVAK